nr:2-amino-4-hydroxy-6-hydroxymethyldihydropteridine diphosphokinase [Altericroceibacterium xinjiangense]
MHRYLIALGSNQRHVRHGAPEDVLRASLAALEDYGEDDGVRVLAVSPMIRSAPVGPSLRRYANAAALVESEWAPEELLRVLKRIEHAFGRRSRGQRWRARVLDLDIVLWSGGIHASRNLAIPHRLFRTRDFVLGPAATIAPDWRDPVTGLCLRHLKPRLTTSRPLPR